MTFRDAVNLLNRIDMLQTNTYYANMESMVEAMGASIASGETTKEIAALVEMIRDQGKAWSHGEMLYVAKRCESMDVLSELIADKYRKIIHEQSR